MLHYQHIPFKELICQNLFLTFLAKDIPIYKASIHQSVASTLLPLSILWQSLNRSLEIIATLIT